MSYLYVIMSLGQCNTLFKTENMKYLFMNGITFKCNTMKSFIIKKTEKKIIRHSGAL